MKRGLAAASAALTLIVPAAASAARMLPWPSDQYTKLDKRTDTGLRLNLRVVDFCGGSPCHAVP
jgi:hypothetical protein